MPAITPHHSAKWCRRSLRLAIYVRDGFECVFHRRCGGVFPLGRELTLDHVVPRSAGGPNTAENLITACVACNVVRGAREFRGRDLKTAQRAVQKTIDRRGVLGLLVSGWDPELAAVRVANSQEVMQWI